jgi:ADP-heptose:LPS heptosyltransferase
MTMKFLLEHKLAPGDVVVSTAVVRDLKLTYGDDIAIDFITNFPAVYDNNPYLTKLDPHDKNVKHITLDYSAELSRASISRAHFTTAFHANFTKQTGIKVEPLFSKPDLHLSEEDKANPPITGRYWVVFGGGKSDVVVKHWEYKRYQQVVDALRPYGLRFVQSGAKQDGHTHPPMENVLNIVGWGGIREMMWQIYHAEGVICPITCAMHMSAAFDKPCVVVAAGREEPWWEAYVNNYGAFGPKAKPVKVEHIYLHTVGLLDCCLNKGCWKMQVIPSKKHSDKYLCKNTTHGLTGQKLPVCMDMITVDHVAEAVMSYYKDRTLPPIGAPKLQSQLNIPVLDLPL